MSIFNFFNSIFFFQVGKTNPKQNGKALGTFTQILAKQLSFGLFCELFSLLFCSFLHRRTCIGKGVLLEMLKAFSVSECLQ